jgi:hypothetical protein
MEEMVARVQAFWGRMGMEAQQAMAVTVEMERAFSPITVMI